MSVAIKTLAFASHSVDNRNPDLIPPAHYGILQTARAASKPLKLEDLSPGLWGIFLQLQAFDRVLRSKKPPKYSKKQKNVKARSDEEIETITELAQQLLPPESYSQLDIHFPNLAPIHGITFRVRLAIALAERIQEVRYMDAIKPRM